MKYLTSVSLHCLQRCQHFERVIIQTNYISIHSVHQDVSSDICFITGTCCKMNQQTKCCILDLPNGFRNCSFSKVFLCVINYTSIDRTDQDLSSEICFIIGTYSRMNQSKIYYILLWGPTNFPPLFFLIFISIFLLFFNLLYIVRKPRTRCIFWYPYIKHQMQFKV